MKLQNLPIFFILILFPLLIKAQEKDNKVGDSLSINKTSISFETVDRAPLFPGCDKFSDPGQQKKCTAEKINNFVNRTMNIDKLRMKGRNTTYIRFTITTTGEIVITEAISTNAEFKDEAIRVVNSLPVMEPGIQDGQKVEVTYAMPITLTIF